MAGSGQTEPDASFEALLEYIRENRGFDFTGYKRQSLARRVDKRMHTVGIEGYDAYRQPLDSHPDEFVDLFNTILINVTGFFRDSPAWEFVQSSVVPRIVESKLKGEPIRVWSTGCASGEEAYTLAIVLAEILGEGAFRDQVKIYATDVDEEALTDGRHAAYSLKSVDSVPPEILDRYFERIEHRYVVRPDLRRAVIFGRHDLVQDPPISKIDLLASRNTLMYFTPDAQARILANFHFALLPSGFLFLGKSEVLLSRNSLFAPLDMKRHVFQKGGGANHREPTPHLDAADAAPAPAPPPQPDDGAIRDSTFEVSPVAQIVIDRDGILTLANQHARVLFSLSPRDVGRPLQDLELSYRPLDLRSLIDQVYDERHAVAQRNVAWHQTRDQERTLDVSLVPLLSTTETIIGISISFSDVTRYRVLQREVETSKRELETAYEELQSNTEELETTNEELQSTNEELETTNEELQSTNEELETMNEELQSTNEELETINEELNQRTDELNSINAFLESILSSIEGGVIAVDGELRVTAWNPGAQELWGLRREEVEGIHLMNLDIGLPVEELRVALRQAMNDGGQPSETVLNATNRRGKPLRCKVICTPLQESGAMRGAILFMEEVTPT
jgi:two-component system, chemotaxis family, CheB/CheR fusion protein